MNFFLICVALFVIYCIYECNKEEDEENKNDGLGDVFDLY
jgi:hypothetical protein